MAAPRILQVLPDRPAKRARVSTAIAAAALAVPEKQPLADLEPGEQRDVLLATLRQVTQERLRDPYLVMLGGNCLKRSQH